jgi:hypothetical protein
MGLRENRGNNGYAVRADSHYLRGVCRADAAYSHKGQPDRRADFL